MVACTSVFSLRRSYSYYPFFMMHLGLLDSIGQTEQELNQAGVGKPSLTLQFTWAWVKRPGGGELSAHDTIEQREGGRARDNRMLRNMLWFSRLRDSARGRQVRTQESGGHRTWERHPPTDPVASPH